MSEPKKPMTTMPLENLPAQTRATVAYLGVASGYSFDMSLEDEPVIEVIVTARDEEMLRRFFKLIKFKDYEPAKTAAVALVKRETVVLQKQERSSSADDEEL